MGIFWPQSHGSWRFLVIVTIIGIITIAKKKTSLKIARIFQSFEIHCSGAGGIFHCSQRRRRKPVTKSNTGHWPIQLNLPTLGEGRVVQTILFCTSAPSKYFLTPQSPSTMISMVGPNHSIQWWWCPRKSLLKSHPIQSTYSLCWDIRLRQRFF